MATDKSTIVVRCPSVTLFSLGLICSRVILCSSNVLYRLVAGAAGHSQTASFVPEHSVMPMQPRVTAGCIRQDASGA